MTIRNRARSVALGVLGLLPSKARVRLLRHLKGRDQRRRIAEADLVVVSFPKSGRTWFRLMLSRCYAESFGLDRDSLLKGDNFHRKDRRVPRVMFFHGSFLEEVAGGGDPLALFEGKRVIFLIRNPIDTAVSCYFHILGGRTDPQKREMKGIPDSLADVPMAEFVSTSQWSVGRIVRFLNDWNALLLRHPRVLTVGYEALRADPSGEMQKVSGFLGSPFTGDAIAAAVAASDFERLKAQERQGQFANAALQPRNSGDPNSYKVRRGKVGGYVDYLDAATVDRLEGEVAAELAPSLGYSRSVRAG